MTVFTIPFARPFLESLVQGIQDRYGHDPLLLAQTVVLLPTRRGCLNLKSAFRGTQNKSKTLALPRIIALADLEQMPNLPGYMPEPLPPEMPKMQQLGLLSQLILAFEKKQSGPKKSTMGAAKALKLAEDLLSLLDEIHTSDVDPTKLKDLVGDEFAHHWQITLDFLQIITDFWPTILAEKGFMDSSIRRRENLRSITKNWHPETPVILAGTTATRPATADLGMSIARLPHGHVVLPGFDTTSPCDDLPPTHPQYTLSQFVAKLGVVPQDIPDWTEIPTDGNPNPGQSLLRHMMAPVLDNVILRPHRGTQDLEILKQVQDDKGQRDPEPLPLRFRSQDDRERQATTPFTLLECQDLENEAMSIAVLIRRSIHDAMTENRAHPIIAVITPDQELTRRIQANLQRWNIKVNSSSGTPLGQTVVGTFLTLIAGLHHRTTAVDWLALLKHPLFFRHLERGTHLSNCRQLDLHLRKLRLPHLFDIKTAPESLQEWYREILTLIAPLISLSGQNPLDVYLTTLRKVAQDLCAPPKLWTGPDGVAAQTYLQDLLPFSADYPKVSSLAFASLLSQLMNQQSVHEPEGIGSPVMILGALEARQYAADITILSGLNEGTWPKGVESDPWLNHQMRLNLSLPDPQRRIGLSAHDFCIGFSGDNIFLTRSLKSNGTSTTPSRWWQRLEVTLETMGMEVPLNKEIPALAKQLDRPIEPPIPITPPSPRPPKERRPLTYSVTDIEQLMRDPYSHYAKRVLSLRKLDPLDRELEARDFGQLVHQALDDFQKKHGDVKDLDLLLTEGRRVFAPLMNDAIVKRFWWPRFEQIAHWIHQTWRDRPDAQVFTEIPGSLFLMISDEQVEIKTIIDRVELNRKSEEDQLTIIDYKTGMLPTQRDVANGLSPQLALESLIFLNGGCGVSPDHGALVDENHGENLRFKESQLSSLQYWWLKGGLDGGEIRPTKNLQELLTASKQGLNDLLGHFIRDQSPYLCCPWDESTAKGKDYHHLARLKEWR